MKNLIEKEVQPTHLKCVIGPRYLEDSKFSKDGINFEYDDEFGTFVKENLEDFCGIEQYKGDDSFINNDGGIYISLTIDLNEGKIVHWPKGICAQFNYKSCDVNDFILYQGEEEIVSLYDRQGYSYVIGPNFMNEFGDYFVIEVDENGYIIRYDKSAMIESIENSLNNREY